MRWALATRISPIRPLTTTQAVRIRYALSVTPMATDTPQVRKIAYSEVRNWHPQQHAPSCGCNPCMAVRSVLAKAR